MTTPILQFGTSRFLQAHADLFVSEALEKGEALGHVAVIQTSGSAERAGRLKGLAVEGGFPVHIRGLEQGAVVDDIRRVTSVTRTFSTATDWAAIGDLFVNEALLVLCNTADRGYDISMEGDVPGLPVPLSFPGKLTALLRARFEAGKEGLTVLPCELISRNGEVLSGIVAELSMRWYGDAAFDAWLLRDVLFCNTLVDRIVSEPLEPAGAVAEPYALWAIERRAGQVLPCRHPAIVVADDISPYERLKLFILNLGHTFLADRFLKSGLRADLTVREFLADGATRSALLNLYVSEIVPAFALQGMEQPARAYVTQTMERFENPFLDHRLSDIAQNHAEKIRRRAGGLLDWTGLSDAPQLRALLAQVA